MTDPLRLFRFNRAYLVLKAPTAALLSIIFQGGWFKSGTSRTQVERLLLRPACPSRIFRLIITANIQKAYTAKKTRMQRTQETSLNQEAKITKWYQSVAKSLHNLSLNKRMSRHSAPKHVVGIPENSLLQLLYICQQKSFAAVRVTADVVKDTIIKHSFDTIISNIIPVFFSLDCSKDHLITW